MSIQELRHLYVLTECEIVMQPLCEEIVPGWRREMKMSGDFLGLQPSTPALLSI